MSVGIMRAFVEMRRFIAGNALLFERMNAVKLRQLEYQRSTDERFGRVFDCIEEQSRPDAPSQKIFFQGQIYDALSLLEDLVSRAERQIFLVDGYVDRVTLDSEYFAFLDALWAGATRHPRAGEWIALSIR